MSTRVSTPAPSSTTRFSSTASWPSRRRKSRCWRSSAGRDGRLGRALPRRGTCRRPGPSGDGRGMAHRPADRRRGRDLPGGPAPASGPPRGRPGGPGRGRRRRPGRAPLQSADGRSPRASSARRSEARNATPPTALSAFPTRMSGGGAFKIGDALGVAIYAYARRRRAGGPCRRVDPHPLDRVERAAADVGGPAKARLDDVDEPVGPPGQEVGVDVGEDSTPRGQVAERRVHQLKLARASFGSARVGSCPKARTALLDIL